jgi:hypothetical protein
VRRQKGPSEIRNLSLIKKMFFTQAANSMPVNGQKTNWKSFFKNQFFARTFSDAFCRFFAYNFNSQLQLKSS